MYPGMMERPRVWSRTNTWAGAFGQNEDKADEMTDARCEHVGGWPGRANPPGDRARAGRCFYRADTKKPALGRLLVILDFVVGGAGFEPATLAV